MSRPRPVDASSFARGATRDGQKRKLAEVVADQIESDIAEMGWPVGEVIGSEAELLARYGVSRAVFREAVRIVEHHFVASMRRGPRGGLVVTAPDIGAIVRAVTLQLQYQAIEPVQVYEARAALELHCVRLAAERITPEGAAVLQEYLRAEEALEPRELMVASHDLHVLIAELTGNPALRLFVRIMGRLTEEQSPHPGTPAEASEVHRAHLRIGEAVLSGDADTAERRMKRHLGAITAWLRPAAQAAKRRRASA